MEVNKSEINSEFGTIKIADEVVATVAGLAAAEVEGVASMSGGWGTDLVERLGRKTSAKVFGSKSAVKRPKSRYLWSSTMAIKSLRSRRKSKRKLNKR